MLITFLDASLHGPFFWLIRTNQATCLVVDSKKKYAVPFISKENTELEKKSLIGGHQWGPSYYLLQNQSLFPRNSQLSDYALATLNKLNPLRNPKS